MVHASTVSEHGETPSCSLPWTTWRVAWLRGSGEEERTRAELKSNTSLGTRDNSRERDYNLIRLEPSARIAFGDSTPKDIIKRSQQELLSRSITEVLKAVSPSSAVATVPPFAPSSLVLFFTLLSAPCCCFFSSRFFCLSSSSPAAGDPTRVSSLVPQCSSSQTFPSPAPARGRSSQPSLRAPCVLLLCPPCLGASLCCSASFVSVLRLAGLSPQSSAAPRFAPAVSSPPPRRPVLSVREYYGRFLLLSSVHAPVDRSLHPPRTAIVVYGGSLLVLLIASCGHNVQTPALRQANSSF